MAPVPEEKHVWVQPRVVRPTKPKKTPGVNYMSESAPSPAPACPPAASGRAPFALGGGVGGSWRAERSPGQQTAGSRVGWSLQKHNPKTFLKSGIF